MSIFNRKKNNSMSDGEEERFFELFSKAMEAASENSERQKPILLKYQKMT